LDRPIRYRPDDVRRLSREILGTTDVYFQDDAVIIRINGKTQRRFPVSVEAGGSE
jgi:hypothetical protein